MAKTVTALLEQAMGTADDKEALACLKLARREYRNEGIKLAAQTVVVDDRELNEVRAELTTAVNQNRTLLNEIDDLSKQLVENKINAISQEMLDNASAMAQKSKRFAIASAVMSVIVLILLALF